MRNLVVRLWKDEKGFILSSELVLIGTIGILSLVVGLAAVSDAVNSELTDCAQAFGAINGYGRYGENDGHRGGRGGDWNGGGNGGGWDSADQSAADGGADIAGTMPGKA